MALIVDARRFDERQEFLTRIGQGLLKPSMGNLVRFRLARMKTVTEAYFILNECYKAWRIAPGHFTEEPKIAAITCAAIQKIVPFVPQTPNMVTTVGEAKCNEIFALNCAAAIIGVPLGDGGFKQDFWLRLLDILSDIECRTLDAFVTDINNQRQKPMEDYVRKLHRKDQLELNSLISIFEILCNKHRPKA